MPDGGALAELLLLKRKRSEKSRSDGWKTEAPLKEKWKTGLKEGTKQKEVANKKAF